MPIRPENRHLYPQNWDDIRERVLARAGNQCEGCGLSNHSIGFRDGSGRFHQLDKAQLDALSSDDGETEIFHRGERQKIFKIILTVAHLNHKPYDCRDENLKAWCQKCHNAYDAKHRAAGRKQREALKIGQGILLE